MPSDGTGAYRLGWTLVARLPAWPARALFFLIAEAAWHRQGAGVRQLCVNLAQVTGSAPDSAHVRRLARLGVHSYLRYWQVDEPRATVRILSRRLAAGGVICLLADRDVTGAGLPVLLHGRATTMPAGPARPALSTGAALVPAGVWYGRREVRVRLHEEIVAPPGADRRHRAAAMTQALADVFTDAIRRHPQDWHVLQPVWPPTGAPPGG